MANYSKGGFLPNEIINYFNHYWEENQDKVKYHSALVNVINIRRINLAIGLLNSNMLEAQFLLSDLVYSHHKDQNLKNKMAPGAYYILEYTKGSFTKMHVDNLKGNGATTITLLHKTEDLSGGYILTKGEDEEFFDVIEQDVGEVVVYNSNVKHGVSKVNSGTRRVLVSWFNEKD
jgi:Rps23 Pro-64 3,4-dihydroxylase Tpa1-like proline 4-hydroxylase